MTTVEAQARALAETLERFIADGEAELTAAWADAWETAEPGLQVELENIYAENPAGATAWQVAAAAGVARAIVRLRRRLEKLLTEYTQQVTRGLPGELAHVTAAYQRMLTTQGVSTINPWATSGVADTATAHILAGHTSLPPAVESAMRAALIRGMVVGENPAAVARRVVKQTGTAFKGGLPRAMMIARTEMLDAARRVGDAAAAANPETVTGWVWVSSLDARTCPACLAMHGTEHPVGEEMQAHHNCRCAKAPLTRGVQAGDITQTGQEWYEGLTVDAQKAAVGETRHQLLSDGSITWEDLATTKPNPGWRTTIVPTPVHVLRGRT